MNRQMVMVGFLQAQNCTNLPSSWRHPQSRDDAHSADYYQEIARVLEAGKFHMAFFDDRLAMPDRYGNDHAHTVEYGIRATKMDPLIVLMTMSAVTTKLGLASTCSTTYFEPFDVARRFATLDLMTQGRAAWNVVTSVNDGEAHNMGREEHLAHDLRYDRADEFMEVVLGHWDTWDDGAIVIDKKTGRYADPSKVKRLDHKGKFFASRGPFTVPRSPQGHPVVIQAGASGRGQRFAGRWGEVIFAAARNTEQAKEAYAAVKGEAARLGRDAHHMSICNILMPVAGATKAEAEDKMATISKLPLEIDALSLLAEALNFDFASKGIDEPFTTEELKGMTGMLGIRDGVLKRSGKKFQDVSPVSGDVFQQVWASRGASFGDLDNDGDIDVVVSNCNGPAYVIRNEGGNRNHWIGLELQGKKSNRDGLGARVKLVLASGKAQYNLATTTASYLSAIDRRVLFGLGTEEKVKELEILWPSGVKQLVSNPAIDQYLKVVESEGKGN
jgi:FMN-dependent oxidoreductase (nitrilotriacetate monooxygenase family)